MGWGRFRKKLTKTVEKTVHTVVAPAAKPITKALTPIVGKSVAGIVADPLGKVAQIAHPATVGLGKVDATLIGLESGLVGAVALKNSSKTVGKTGSELGAVAIPIEKVGVGVALSAIGAGALSGLANAGLNAAIPPDQAPAPSGGDSGGGGGGDGTASAADAGASSTFSPVLLGVLAVVVLLALKG